MLQYLYLTGCPFTWQDFPSLHRRAFCWVNYTTAYPVCNLLTPGLEMCRGCPCTRTPFPVFPCARKNVCVPKFSRHRQEARKSEVERVGYSVGIITVYSGGSLPHISLLWPASRGRWGGGVRWGAWLRRHSVPALTPQTSQLSPNGSPTTAEAK